LNAENAIVKPETAALMAAGGLGLEETFIKPTYIELIQKSSRREDVRPGTFFDVLTSTEFTELQVVALGIKRGRVYFPEGGELSAKPICRSDDGIKPSPFAQIQQSVLCGTCGKASWDDYDKKTGHGKPSCQDAWQMLFVLRDTGLPRRINIKTYSLKATKLLLEQMKQDIIMAKAKGEGVRNIFDYTFNITSQKVDGPKGVFYILKYTNVKRLSEIGEFGPLFEQYVLSARARQAEREVDEALEAAVEAEAPVEV
jgi:hypothetical protein